jgi:hypothetical protein
MLVHTIKMFKTCLYNSVKKINNHIKSRNDKIVQFRDIIYYSSISIGNGYSYDLVNSHLKINNILDVSKNTLIKHKNKLDHVHILTLNDSLLEYVYDTNNRRIIGVDGTYIILLKMLHEYGFNISSNDNYCIALLSTLFDIEKEMPINYSLFKNKDERKGLLEQLKYLKPYDILIMDRGYFSNDLLFTLCKNKIIVVFRLKINLKILNNLKKCDDCTINIQHNTETIKLRLIKYTIGNKIYYLGTTIYNRSIGYIKDLYWRRWKIETHFKYSKYNLSLKELKSKSENTIMQDILIHHFIFIISSYFQHLLQQDINKKYKISTTNHINITVNNLLYPLLYEKSTSKNINKICTILNISKKVLVPIKTDRKHKRTKKRPSSKWCQYGNKFKMIH